jgi:hypothetical protein
MSYITILDFEAGRVFQYDMKASDYVRNKDIEEFLTNKGHNLSNCDWMQHENPQVITK